MRKVTMLLAAIGPEVGDVVVEGERIYGDGVNIAARLEGLAEAGGICIAGTVYGITSLLTSAVAIAT
jgi:class 3 adenylate cyclase